MILFVLYNDIEYQNHTFGGHNMKATFIAVILLKALIRVIVVQYQNIFLNALRKYTLRI